MKHCNNKTKAEVALNGFMRLCLGRFPFFFFWLLLLGFFPSCLGNVGREGGCALGGQLCAALTGCV